MKGKIVKYKPGKGYGFIRYTQLDEDVFVHSNDSEDTLEEGIIVKFDLQETPKGYRAENVKRVV